MRQSPRYFFKYLSKKFEHAGLYPLKLDPCLFLGKGVAVIMWVDDLLVYGQTEEDITNVINKLKADGVKLRR
jgi:hypothetical protein